VKAARKILDMGLLYLIIKKGDNGALLFGRDGQMFFAPALPLENVSDPTGAGDSFAGGFCGYIAAKGSTDFETAKAAVIAGSVMGSFCCEKFGTENLLSLSEQTVATRVKQFEEMCRFKY
jgi:sugar/nucleoside kinase (ribokinase family)